MPVSKHALLGCRSTTQEDCPQQVCWNMLTSSTKKVTSAFPHSPEIVLDNNSV